MSSRVDKPPSSVGLIAPAGPPLDTVRLERGIAELTNRGIELVRARADYPTTGFLAGTDAERLDEFNAIAGNPELSVVFCVRGGYGTLRLLGGIDYDKAAKHPKVLVGYSDITGLQLALYHRAGWKGLSGPMVAVEWPSPDPVWEEPLWRLLGGVAPFELAPADDANPTVLRPGLATGPLLGGNLAMVAKLVGTPFCPDFEGAILFLEDVGEQPYRIDGMLAQLRLAGILDRISGAVIGAFTDSDVPSNRPSFTVDQVLDDYFAAADYPVVTHWNYGHFPVKVNMPIGARCSLTAADDVRLVLEESLLA